MAQLEIAPCSTGYQLWLRLGERRWLLGGCDRVEVSVSPGQFVVGVDVAEKCLGVVRHEGPVIYLGDFSLSHDADRQVAECLHLIEDERRLTALVGGPVPAAEVPARVRCVEQLKILHATVAGSSPDPDPEQPVETPSEWFQRIMRCD